MKKSGNTVKRLFCIFMVLFIALSFAGCQYAVFPPDVSEEETDQWHTETLDSLDKSTSSASEDTGSGIQESSSLTGLSVPASDETEETTVVTETVITTDEPESTTEDRETTEKEAETTTKKPKKTTAKTTKPPETTKLPETSVKEDPPPATELYAKDYGATGDGITDDGPAISMAVRDAVSSHLPLYFEPGKTYRIETATNRANPFTSPFIIKNASDVTIDGRGAKFIYNPDLAYYPVTESGNVTIRNCTFDYIDSVYLVGKVQGLSEGSRIVRFSTDIEPVRDSFDYSGYTAFSIKYNTGIQGCSHKFISRMDKTGSKEVTVTYKSNTNYKVGDTVFLPNPGIGHVKGETIYIGQNRGNLLFENIKINASGSFVFSVKGNDAEITFRKVDFVPSETMSREIGMVAWRDGYHCKDNRKPIYWENCYMDPHGGLFDDVFNVSCTLGAITAINQDGSLDALNIEFKNRGQNVPFDCRAGDVLDFYSLNTGVFCGTAEVERITSAPGGGTRIYLKDHSFISEPTLDCVIGNRATCAPGSIIKNCIFSGSYRFLRDISILNSELYIRSIWIMVEGSVEGPLPGNVLFRNTQLHGGTLEIDAYNRNTKTYMPDIAAQINGIRAENCEYFYFSFKCNTGKCNLEGFN